MTKPYKLFLIFISSFLMGLSQYPSGLGFLSFIALVPLIPVINTLISYKKAIKIGLAWGIVYNTTTVYWLMFNVGTSNLLAFITMICSVFILSLGPVLIFLLWCMLRKRGQSIFTLVLIWPSIELIRSYGTLGFPWVSISNSLTTYNTIIQNAEYVGIYGLSSLIVLINIIIFKLLENRTTENLLVLIVAIFIPITSGELIKISEEENSSRPLKILSIQPNVSLANKRDSSKQDSVINNLISQSKSKLDSSIDLIIWPETVTSTYLLKSDTNNFLKVKKFLNTTDAALISGILHYEKGKDGVNYNTYNSVTYLNDTDNHNDIYHKIRLVPGAEYVPFSKYFKSLDILNFGVGNFSHGSEYKLFKLKEFSFASMVCLESTFPNLSRNFVKKGANFIVYVVNDGWYTSAPEPWQHASRSIFRAVETRRPVIRCANTGISLVIDKFGNIKRETELNKQDEIVNTIFPNRGLTFYVKYGDIFIYFMMIMIVFLIIRNRVEYKNYV